ncbi:MULTISPECIES: transporter substrate-binding domain-containing protein [Colwellia]|nr:MULTISPECIES: transporter substrate-binding domain-containing protein [Colwellia]
MTFSLKLFPSPPMLASFISFTVFIGALYSVTYSATAQSEPINEQVSKKKILWLVEDKIENIDLLAKNSAESSTASYIENLIIQQLKKSPQYDVQIVRVTAPRINKMLITKDDVCVANRAKTPERREYSLFSDPQSFYLTHKLYRFNQKSALPSQLFNTKGEIKNLASVFKSLPTQTMGVAQDVSFGNFLDQQIKQINPENIYYRGGNQRVVALASMLYKSRVDFVLALPVDITPNEAQKTLLEQYTIAGAPPYLIAHFNCSNSQLGQGIINDINKILAKVYQSKDYYQAHKKWFSDKQLAGLQTFLAEKFAEKKYLDPTQ